MTTTIHSSGKIFVFGSNLAGRHGKGAAKEAMKYGAIYRVSRGRQGNTFAIPTKDCQLKTLPIRRIKFYVEEFLEYAQQHPEIEFYLTAVGTGLAGYRDEDIAPLFRGVSKNVEIPNQWKEYIKAIEVSNAL